MKQRTICRQLEPALLGVVSPEAELSASVECVGRQQKKRLRDEAPTGISTKAKLVLLRVVEEPLGAGIVEL